ncbi:hypothetical protein TFLX_03532 [Thermoflexales bacterium]|nr:hypothetical protein TFLX_03532 [Thermoflexales bacterium]
MSRIKSFLLASLLGLSVLGGALPTRAARTTFQSPLQSPTPVIASIEPTSIRRDRGGTLTVLGDGFEAASVVRLVNVGVLQTTFVNTTTLTALVPTEVKPGTYTVEVRNGDGATATAPTQLTIKEAPPPPEPTEVPQPPPPAQYVRPLLTVAAYSTDPAVVVAGKPFKLIVAIKNVADDTAFNTVLTVPSGDFIPVGNAGTQSVNKVHIGETITFIQDMQAKSGIGGGLKPIELKIAYNDRNGGSYNETPSITINMPGGSGRAAPTAVPKLPQLIVSNYNIAPQELIPGTEFKLRFQVQNVGTGDATRLSVVLGGAASADSSSGNSGDSSGSGSGGTSGGVSGAGGDFATFGPMGSSNVKFYPRVTVTDTLEVEQQLIVNSTAKAGAYTVKVSLVYDDPKGQRRTDDQVITLRVLVPPIVEISYAREPGPAIAGQPWPVSLQTVNIGRATTQLSKMEIVTPLSVTVQNGSTFIGQLEAGGQFPLDAVLIPSEAGVLPFVVQVHYLDDFNRPQIITQTFEVNVEPQPEEPPIDPTQPSAPVVLPPAEESLGDQLLRLVLGLLGLDSARPPSTPLEPGMPTEPIEPGEQQQQPVPVRPMPMGKG